MAKDRKVEEDKKGKQSKATPNTLYWNKYKPLPKFKGCTNC